MTNTLYPPVLWSDIKGKELRARVLKRCERKGFRKTAVSLQTLADSLEQEGKGREAERAKERNAERRGAVGTDLCAIVTRDGSTGMMPLSIVNYVVHCSNGWAFEWVKLGWRGNHRATPAHTRIKYNSRKPKTRTLENRKGAAPKFVSPLLPRTLRLF